jgi:hypothetical protein
MSSMGVPFSMSSLLTSMLEAPIPCTSTTDIPIGLSLTREQELITLVFLPTSAGVTRERILGYEGSITTMHWLASKSRRHSEYSSSMTSVPFTPKPDEAVSPEPSSPSLFLSSSWSPSESYGL